MLNQLGSWGRWGAVGSGSVRRVGDPSLEIALRSTEPARSFGCRSVGCGRSRVLEHQIRAVHSGSIGSSQTFGRAQRSDRATPADFECEGRAEHPPWTAAAITSGEARRRKGGLRSHDSPSTRDSGPWADRTRAPGGLRSRSRGNLEGTLCARPRGARGRRGRGTTRDRGREQRRPTPTEYPWAVERGAGAYRRVPRRSTASGRLAGVEPRRLQSVRRELRMRGSTLGRHVQLSLFVRSRASHAKLR